MPARKHLFVAPQKAPFGEAVLGLRIAKELESAGDSIVYLAHETLGILAENTSFRQVPFEANEAKIDEEIARVAEAERAHSIVLLDATSVFMRLKSVGTDEAFLRKMPVPVIGLDVWNLEETDLRWDLCGATWEHSRHSLAIKNRLIPVPFAKAKHAPGRYNSLPPHVPPSAAQRSSTRRDLGVGDGDKLILLASAHWQHPALQAHANGQRLATAFPTLLAELLGRLGGHVHVVHVGPEPYPLERTLGERYNWVAQRNPARFARLLASADLYVTFNFSATTIISAIGAGVPTVLGVNSHAGTAEEIVASLAAPPSAPVLAWIHATAPLCRFRVWPLGLHRFLGPLAEGNAYTTTFRTTEVLDEAPFVEACRALLFDEAARSELRARQDEYRRLVATLPSAASLVRSYL